jgi:hypothetical protein
MYFLNQFSDKVSSVQVMGYLTEDDAKKCHKPFENILEIQ